MRTLKFFIFAIAVLFAGLSWGASNTSSDFLRMETGVKAIGMGSNYVAATDDVNSVFWNPAGLSSVLLPEISIMHTIWLQDFSYEYIGYAVPAKLGKSGIGVSINYFWLNPFDSTEGIEEPIKANNLSVNLSYGLKLMPILDSGITLKYLRYQLKDTTADGVAFDLGGKLKFLEEKLTLGVAIQNMGNGMKFVEEVNKLPLSLRLGAGYNTELSDFMSMLITSDFTSIVNQISYIQKMHVF